MQQVQQRATDLTRIKTTVDALISAKSCGEGIPELVHDARNMVTALALYCDLLEEPGVLTVKARHYARELRLVAAASRQLVENMARADRWERAEGAAAQDGMHRSFPVLAAALPGTAIPKLVASGQGSQRNGVESLALELSDNLNLLQAVAGARIAIHTAVRGGARAVGVSPEDLTRLLVNLVRNAAEAIKGSGTIDISLSESVRAGVPQVLLTVEDSGPGIPKGDLERVFEAGYSTRAAEAGMGGSTRTRGLGLSIVQSVVEAAGGRIRARRAEQGGTCIEVELPILAL